MSLRSSSGLAFGAAFLLSPSIAFAVTTVSEGGSPFNNAESAVATVLILGFAYVVTLLGLLMVGAPLTYWLDRSDGSIAIGFVNGLIAVASFIAAAMTSDFFRMIWLTLGLVVTIFTVLYLRADRVMQSGTDRTDA